MKFKGIPFNLVKEKILNTPEAIRGYQEADKELAKTEMLYDDVMVNALREDPAFAQAYLHQAFLDIDEDGGQEGFLLALRHVVEAFGGMATVAQKSGSVARVSLPHPVTEGKSDT